MKVIAYFKIKLFHFAIIFFLVSACEAKLEGDVTQQTVTPEDISQIEEPIAVNDKNNSSSNVGQSTPKSDKNDTPVFETTPTELELLLSNLSIDSVDYQSFALSLPYHGDKNNNANISLHYCSVKQSLGCNPSIDGVFSNLNKNNTTFNLLADLSSPPFSPGDVVKYKMTATDVDGVIGGENQGSIIIPFNTSIPRKISQLGYVSSQGINASGDDIATAMVITEDDSVIVAGQTFGSFGEANARSKDAFIAKFDANGNYKWIQQLGIVSLGNKALGDEIVNALALDSKGNILIAGSTTGDLGEANSGGRDAFIAKFDVQGYLIWISQLGNLTVGVGANGNEIVTALTVSDNDTIYIAGETDGDLKETNAGNKDAFIAKFDKNGIHQWTQQLGNTSIGAAASGNDLVAGISINSSGNLFITGTTDGNLGEANGGGNDAYIAKFDANGTHIWTSQLGGITVGAAAAGNDLANAIAITNTGEVIIAGSTNGDLGETNSGLSDIYVSKFSTTGTHLWTQQLGTSSIAAAAVGDDQVSAISLDSNGNIFVTGRTSGSLGEAVGGSYDSYIAKFNSNGAYQWIRQLGNITIGAGASMTDSGNAIALDSSGHIIIAGNTLGALSQLNGGSSDIYAAKLASDNSSILWTSQIGAATLGSGSAGNDIALASVVDANGALLVAGYTYGSVGEANGGSSDILITKFDANGHYVWAKQLGKVTMGSASSGADAATAIALDSNGNILLAGYTTGSLGETAGGSIDVFISKFDINGNYLWTTQLGNITAPTVGANAILYEVATAISIDNSNNIYISGHTSSNFGEVTGGLFDAFVAKFDTNGSALWITQLGDVTVGAAASGSELVYAMTIDTSSNVLIAGTTTGSFGEANAGFNTNDAFIASIDANGALLWIRQMGNTTIGATANSNEYVSSVLTDSSGNIVISGYTHSSLVEANSGFGDGFVAKFNSNGTYLWARQLGSTTIGVAAAGHENLTGMGLDTSDNIYLAGETDGSLGEPNAGSNDAFVFKLDSSGNHLWTRQFGNVTLGSRAAQNEVVKSLSMDISGNIIITGYTTGNMGELNAGSEDIFSIRLDPNGN